jgi:hypothetical protein
MYVIPDQNDSQKLMIDMVGDGHVEEIIIFTEERKEWIRTKDVVVCHRGETVPCMVHHHLDHFGQERVSLQEPTP